MRTARLTVALLLFGLLRPAAAADPESDGTRLRAAVLALEARGGVDPDLVALVSEHLAGEVSRQSGFEVVADADVRRFLNLEQMRQMLGCDDALDCYTEASGVLDVDRLVSGTIGALEGVYLVSLHLLDTHRHRPLARASFQAEGNRQALLDGLRTAVGELLRIPATLHVYPQIDGAEVLVDDRPVATLPSPPIPIQRGGSATVRVEHFDYPSFERTVELVPGRTTRLRLDMHAWHVLERRARAHRWSGYGLLGASAATAVGSGLAFHRALAIKAEYDALDPRTVTQAELDAVGARGRRQYGLAYTGAAGAAALAGAGVWMLLHNPWEQRLAVAEGGWAGAGVTVEPGLVLVTVSASGR